MRKFVVVMTVVAVLSLPGCNRRHPDTVWDTEYDFAGLATYDWAPKEPETGPDLPYEALDGSIKSSIERALREAGFTRSADNPSFLVTYYIGVEEVTAIEGGYYGPGWGGYWGWGWYSPVGLNVSQYDTGTITVDFLSRDPAIGLIWRGIARTDLGPASRNAGVDGAVREIISEFPPRSR